MTWYCQGERVSCLPTRVAVYSAVVIGSDIVRKLRSEHLHKISQRSQFSLILMMENVISQDNSTTSKRRGLWHVLYVLPEEQSIMIYRKDRRTGLTLVKHLVPSAPALFSSPSPQTRPQRHTTASHLVSSRFPSVSGFGFTANKALWHAIGLQCI